MSRKLHSSKRQYESKPLILVGDSGAHKNPYEKWKSDVDALTPKGWAKTAKETGYPAFIGGPIERDASTDRTLSFPPNWCVYCGERCDPAQVSKGLTIFNASYPEIGIRVGDRATHYMCYGCCEEMVFPTRPVIETPQSELVQRRREWALEAQERMVEYVKAQRSIGVEGRIFGDESRREKYKDADNKEL